MIERLLTVPAILERDARNKERDVFALGSRNRDLIPLSGSRNTLLSDQGNDTVATSARNEAALSAPALLLLSPVPGSSGCQSKDPCSTWKDMKKLYPSLSGSSSSSSTPSRGGSRGRAPGGLCQDKSLMADEMFSVATEFMSTTSALQVHLATQEFPVLEDELVSALGRVRVSFFRESLSDNQDTRSCL